MKKITFFKTLLVAAGLLTSSTNVFADENTATAIVKMTYVDGSDANVNTSYGEVETAQAGYNKINGNSVAMANTGWGCNWITYLQVDASEFEGNITNVTLTFEGSGATDSKRTTCWGVGYNSSVWSSDMTYNTADKSITTIDELKWTKTQSASVFETFSFDITEAFKNSDNNVVTILVYETAAAGGYIKNPKVTVTYTNDAVYDVTFTETNGVKAKVTIDGSDVTNGTSLANGEYTFTATADGYKDYNGSFTVADDNLEVSFTMTAKPVYTYTVTSSYNDTPLAWSVTGTAYEGQVVYIKYPRFQACGKTLVGRAPVNNNLLATITVTEDNYTANLEYKSEGVENLYLLSEAENLNTGLPTGATTFVDRVSNSLIIYGEGGTLLSLPAGKYIFTLGAIGAPNNSSCEYKVSAGEQQIISGTCGGNTLALLKSEEFTLDKETEITFTATNHSSSRGIDLIYVQKTGDVKTLTAEYGTYYSDSALDFSEAGLTAYIATACDGKTVTLKEVESVPANTGVLLKGDAKTYEIPVATETDDVKGNLFEGVTTATEIAAPIYVLYKDNDDIGFYQTTATFTVGANTAYLPASAVAGGDSKLRFVVEGEATAISGIATEKAENGATYNVAGQLVNDNYKGIVIKNGKKYLNK